MKHRAALIVIAGLLVAADEPKKGDAKADLAALQGSWVATAAERNGEKSPAQEIKGFKLVIAGNKMTFPGNRVSTFELESDKSPKVIVATPKDGPHKGEPQRGIYALEKGVLKLCLNNRKAGTAKEFATKKDDGFVFLTLKKEAAKPKDEGKKSAK